MRSFEQTKIQGLTGEIGFDKETGSRRNYTLIAYQTILNNRLINIGSWSSEANQLVSIQKSYQRNLQLANIERNITYIVSVCLEQFQKQLYNLFWSFLCLFYYI